MNLVDIFIKAEKALNFAAEEIDFHVRGSHPPEKGEGTPGTTLPARGPDGTWGSDGRGSSDGASGRAMGDIPQMGMKERSSGAAGGALKNPKQPKGHQKIDTTNLGLHPQDPNDPTISTRNPTAKGRTESPDEVKRLTIGLETMKRDPKKFAESMAKVAEYPNLRIPPGSTPDQIAEIAVQQFEDNLLWLYDNYPKQWAEGAKKWYVGGNKICREESAKVGKPDRAAAGITAALSPQNPWPINMSLTKRVMYAMSNQDKLVFDNNCLNAALKKAGNSKGLKNGNNIRTVASLCMGKRLSEIEDPYAKALFIVAHDEAYSDRGYRIVSPDGTFGAPAITKQKTPGQAKWVGLTAVAKAVSIYNDPSVKNISDQLGKKHKVRNFYNNLIDPSGKYAVTIDTHAVAAAHLRPLGGMSLEVMHNFGSKMGSSSKTGVSGSYGLYAEAYRRAAAKRGILPREMQSIAWEAVKGLFSPVFKRKQQTNAIGIKNILTRAKLTPEQQQKVMDAAQNHKQPKITGKLKKAGFSDEQIVAAYAQLNDLDVGPVDKMWAAFKNDPNMQVQNVRNDILNAAGGIQAPDWAANRQLENEDDIAAAATEPEDDDD